MGVVIPLFRQGSYSESLTLLAQLLAGTPGFRAAQCGSGPVTLCPCLRPVSLRPRRAQRAFLLPRSRAVLGGRAVGMSRQESVHTGGPFRAGSWGSRLNASPPGRGLNRAPTGQTARPDAAPQMCDSAVGRAAFQFLANASGTH